MHTANHSVSNVEKLKIRRVADSFLDIIIACSQLAGLVETTHIVLRLLDSLTKQDGALRVRFHILLLLVDIQLFALYQRVIAHYVP